MYAELGLLVMVAVCQAEVARRKAPRARETSQQFPIVLQRDERHEKRFAGIISGLCTYDQGFAKPPRLHC